jgi:hypothetical protein
MPIYPLLVENLSLGETARNWANDPTQSTTEVAPLSWTVMDLREGGVAPFVVDG